MSKSLSSQVTSSQDNQETSCLLSLSLMAKEASSQPTNSKKASAEPTSAFEETSLALLEASSQPSLALEEAFEQNSKEKRSLHFFFEECSDTSCVLSFCLKGGIKRLLRSPRKAESWAEKRKDRFILRPPQHSTSHCNTLQHTATHGHTIQRLLRSPRRAESWAEKRRGRFISRSPS